MRTSRRIEDISSKGNWRKIIVFRYFFELVQICFTLVIYIYSGSYSEEAGAN